MKSCGRCSCNLSHINDEYGDNSNTVDGYRPYNDTVGAVAWLRCLLVVPGSWEWRCSLANSFQNLQCIETYILYTNIGL